MGESVYKVWTQELFPTLLRSTATGLTMAFTRPSPHWPPWARPPPPSATPGCSSARCSAASCWRPGLGAPAAPADRPERDAVPEDRRRPVRAAR